MIEAFRAVIADDAPIFLLLAGPNGAGKSTYRQKRLEPIGFPCVDPDQVAKDQFGRDPISSEEALQATLVATDCVREHFAKMQSIGLETTFADTRGHKLALIDEAKGAGFRTVLIFIGVDHPQISIARVMDRVDHGGHDVPDEVIERRFPRCFENLKQGLLAVDLALLIDNSGCYGPSNTGADDLRHYEFAIIQRNGPTKLSHPLPRWFTDFHIDTATTQNRYPQ